MRVICACAALVLQRVEDPFAAASHETWSLSIGAGSGGEAALDAPSLGESELASGGSSSSTQFDDNGVVLAATCWLHGQRLSIGADVGVGDFRNTLSLRGHDSGYNGAKHAAWRNSGEPGGGTTRLGERKM